MSLVMGRAHHAVALALRAGTLTRPESCEQCHKRKRLDAAHFDYSQPLRVRWLCRSCHVYWDKHVPKPRPNPESVPPSLVPPVDTRLTRVLVAQGHFRNWMAAQLGIRPWTFSRIERGVQPAPDGYYERAAAILGVAVDDIRPVEEAVAA